jgi:hypothetical protein
MNLAEKITWFPEDDQRIGVLPYTGLAPEQNDLFSETGPADSRKCKETA